MHHAAGNRTGADDADLDHQIIKLSRPKARQHRHLSAAFDLKHPHRVALTNHVVSCFVIPRNRRNRKIAVPIFTQELKAEIELREPAESEQVDFKQAEILHIVLVPLNHRALRHGGVLDRYEIMHRLMAK